MKRRTVVLNGEITTESMGTLGNQMLTLQMESSERIDLIIDSGGGNIIAALQLCDLITNLMTAPVRGIALGDCGSAATFLMLHCAERCATKYSRFLIHSATLSKISIQVNQTTSENIEHLLKEVKATEEKVLQIYAQYLTPPHWTTENPNLEQKRAYAQSLISRGDQRFDDWFSAEEAIRCGLITTIVDGKLDIFS
jgi:ATP-dependent protease ClpP protease subunit